MKAAPKHTRAALAANVVPLARDRYPLREIAFRTELPLDNVGHALNQVFAIALAACDGESDRDGLLHLHGAIRDITHSALREFDEIKAVIHEQTGGDANG